MDRIDGLPQPAFWSDRFLLLKSFVRDHKNKHGAYDVEVPWAYRQCTGITARRKYEMLVKLPRRVGEQNKAQARSMNSHGALPISPPNR